MARRASNSSDPVPQAPTVSAQSRGTPLPVTIFNTPILTPALRVLAAVLLRLIGWRARSRLPLDAPRYVLIGAPHTSNWDFPIMLLVVLKLRLKVYWMGKHTLFPKPFAGFMRWLGGVPINRSASHNTVEQTVRQYQTQGELIILIPPEGTRSKVERWRTGFYHIARLAEVPILLGYLDAEKKEAGFTDVFHPSGDLERDMQAIRAYYARFTGLYPDNA